MKFGHAVKYNGIHYATGEDVPLAAGDEVRIKEEQSIIAKELVEFERQLAAKKNIDIRVIHKSMTAEKLI
jgi:hypothetical protein